jgi:alpha-tubulin suppressor-like RCC1 family protein
MTNYAGDVQVYVPSSGEASADIVFNYHDGSSRQSMGWLVAINGRIYATNTANGHLGTGSTAQGVSLQKIQVPYSFTGDWPIGRFPYNLFIKGTHTPETDWQKATTAWKNRKIEKIIYNNRNCYILMSFGDTYEKWVYTCGDNTYSQLGTDNTNSANYFTPLIGVHETTYTGGSLEYTRDIVDICAVCQSTSGSGNRVWHMICENGSKILEIGCMTANGSQAVPAATDRRPRALPAHPSGKKWVKIQSSSFTIWAIDEDGKLWCMGSNARGQFGDGTTTSSYLVWVNPSWATGGLGQTVFAIGGNANYETVCVSVGVSSGIAIWGANGAGQVGDGTTGNSTVPLFYALIGVNVVNGFIFSGGDESLNNAAVQTAIIVNNLLYVWGNGSDGGNAYGGTTNTLFAPTLAAISQVNAWGDQGSVVSALTLNLTDLYGTDAVWDKLFTAGGRCGGFAITKPEYGSHLYAWGQGVNAQLGMDTAYGADGSNRFLRPTRVPQDCPIYQIYGTSSVLSATAHGLCIARDSDGKILVSGSGKADQQVPVGVSGNYDVKQLRSVLINM